MTVSVRFADIVPRFQELSDTLKRRFLVGYIAELTIIARGHFADSEFERASQCNESIHVIAGYLAAMEKTIDPARDLSFVTMLVKVSEQNGWSELLRRSMGYSGDSSKK